MTRQQVGIAVTVPSCACCSARIEEEVGAALGLPKGSVKFVVPITAQLLYDATVVELGKVVESLKERGCKVSLASARFRIPLRPAFLPTVWKVKVETLSAALPGVVSTSIDFGKSLITVDYLPAFVGTNEIRDALFACRVGQLESGEEEGKENENAKSYRGRSDLEHLRSHNVHSLYSLGPGVSQPCHDEDLGSLAARV